MDKIFLDYFVNIFLIKSFNNPNINNTSVEQTSQTKTVETPKPAPSKPKKEEVKQSQPKEDLTWFAEYACQQEIKARAIYPPSVKVHFRRDNYIKGNSYTIYGTVDSQNAFGAMVRQNFACEAIIDKENDKYWVNDLNIEQVDYEKSIVNNYIIRFNEQYLFGNYR